MHQAGQMLEIDEPRHAQQPRSSLHVGLVQNGIVEKFSLIYFVLLAVNLAVQAITIGGIVTLLRNQLLRTDAASTQATATRRPVAHATESERSEPELANFTR